MKIQKKYEMSYLKRAAKAGEKNIILNSRPLQKVHFTMWLVMYQSGELMSLSALTFIPNTVEPTVSEVYIENNS